MDLPVPDEWLCTVDQVLTLLQSVDPSKASGPDGISARMLQSTAISVAPAIMKLFNLSGIFPSEWKIAQVTPVPKSSQTSDPSQYRPISLLSKLLEKHVHSHLLEHLYERSLISQHQWGFLQGRSTTGALVNAVDAWQNSLEPRAYRPAEGGERACNSRTASTEGEMLAVTKFRTEI